MDEITLRCPKCDRTLQSFRDKSDPPNTVVVETICDRCYKGDFAEVLYFDINGNQILEF